MKKVFLLGTLLCALLLAACGGGDEESTVSNTPTAIPIMTAAPTEPPTEVPTAAPTEVPAEEPTEVPAEEPTAAPTVEAAEAVTATEELTDTTAVTETSAVTETAALTSTAPLSDSEALTATDVVTASAVITAAAAPTATAEMTASEAVTATEALTETAPATSTVVSTETVAGEPITIENVTFTADPALASSWSGALVEDNSDPNSPPDMTTGPRRIAIEGAGEQYYQPYLFVYQVSDLAGTPEESEADLLTTLLNEGETLPVTGTLPFLPRANASQVVHGAMQTLDFANGNGVRYIVAYAQDASPFTARSFRYTFQGLTSDGEYYVAFVMPVTTELFPPEIAADLDYDAFIDDYSNYLTTTIATLGSATATDFTPDLELLDELVESIHVAEPTTASSAAELDFLGTYTASLPGPFPGRPVTLTLGSEDLATLSTDNMNGDGPITETGLWVQNEDGSATVTFTGTATTTYEVANVITFTLNADQLVAVGFSQPENYGTVGLQLQKVATATDEATEDSDETGSAEPPADLVDVTWQLATLTAADGTESMPDDPSKYTIQFGSDWRVAVQADCNRGGGSYESDGDKLVLGQLITTLAACPEASLYDEFMQGLGSVASYVVADDTLTITLADDAGTLTFTGATDEATADSEAAEEGEETASAEPPADLIDVTWQLATLTAADGTESTPDDPSNYTITFGSDWKVAVQADCNRGGGSYNVEGSELTIGPLISTRVACPDDSLYNAFMQGLENVASYEITDGALTIALKDEGGSLAFAPVK